MADWLLSTARMDEAAQRMDFKLAGTIITGSFRNRSFEAIYSPGSRSGRMTFDQTG